VDDIQTTETEEALHNMEAAQVAKKAVKKAAAKRKQYTVTEKARAIVRAKLAAANRPPVNDYR
jgi:DNA-binding PadR family transcriptional regulator